MRNEDIEKLRREIADNIPGFIGYDRVDDRGSSDKAFREYVAEQIQLVLDDLRRLVVFATQTITQEKTLFIDQILYKADKIIRILRRDREIPIEFKESNIPSEYINKLIVNDHKIVKLTLKIKDLMKDLYNKGIIHPEVTIKLKMISEGLDVLLSKVNERLKIIRESISKANENS